MTRSRQEQIHLDSTPLYHCYVRCVRRAFLCGTDHFSGQNFDHRKQWLVSRLRFLSYVYAIDICAYAVMSNHYHVVLHVDKKRAENWSIEEVAQRWLQLYSAPLLVQKWLKNPTDCDKTELEVVTEIVEQWRTRLHDMGWFMRGINEVIARMANAEDKTKGTLLQKAILPFALRVGCTDQKYSRYFCGRAAIKARHYWMRWRSYPAWRM